MRAATAWNVLDQCWSAAATTERSGATQLLPAIQHLVRTLKRTSLVFIVSDFMTDEDVFASHDLAMLAARHDVIAVVPEDRGETSLPAGHGYLTIRDLESRRQIAVGQQNERELVALRQQMLSCTVENRPKDLAGINSGWKDAIQVTDQQPLLQAILGYLEENK